MKTIMTIIQVIMLKYKRSLFVEPVILCISLLYFNGALSYLSLTPFSNRLQKMYMHNISKNENDSLRITIYSILLLSEVSTLY